MGFLSSIGKVIGAVGGTLLGGTTGGALLGIGGNLLSGMLENQAYNKAADGASQAAMDSNYLLARMYDQAREDSAPFRSAANNALSRMQQAQDAGFKYSDLWADPGYQFRLDQGLKGVNQSAAHNGMLRSGDTLKALNDYAQNSASNEYGAAYNRYADAFGRDATIAGLGNQSLQSINSLGGDLTGQQSQNLMNAAATRGSSYVGGSKSISQMLKGIFG